MVKGLIVLRVHKFLQAQSTTYCRFEVYSHRDYNMNPFKVDKAALPDWGNNK